MTRNDRHLDVGDLTQRIGKGEVDTVVIAFTDMQGRLQGKRLHAAYFVDQVLEHGAEGCNYLLGVDVEMNTVPGYAITSWEQGYGDMEFVLDLDTIRLLPHLPATAMIQCDLAWPDHSPVVQSLALQPALHVGEGDHHGVDLSLADPPGEVVHGEVPVVAGHGFPSVGGIRKAARVATPRCPRSAAPWRAAPGSVARR